MSEPDTDELERAAEEIFDEAYDDGLLNELTYGSVRRQIEDKFDLETGFLDGPNYKPFINDAVKRAASRCDADVDIPNSPAPSTKSSKTKTTKESKKRKQMVFKSAEFIATSESENEAEGSSSKKAVPSPKKPKLSNTTSKNTNEEMSDSSEDEAPKPKKRRKSKENDAKKPVKETKPKKQPSATSDKHEERVKRLKALVAACGVRKVWSKVFQDAPKPSQQISILKRMLTDLGMTGRMSMEQAKAIREKRELQQELEDVQTFEKSVMHQASRSRAKANQNPDPESEAEDDQSEEDEPIVTTKRKSARQRIDAFLGSDSD